MKVSKKERHNYILAIINKQDISTQEELVEILRSLHLEVTQATMSRDIKELGLTKVTNEKNVQKYVGNTRIKEPPTSKLITVFSQAVLSCDNAGSIVIVKTLPGMAGASASTIDSLNFPEVVGTLAGDDTIFIATKSSILANHLLDKLKALMI